jgi:hypothetical protein
MMKNINLLIAAGWLLLAGMCGGAQRHPDSRTTGGQKPVEKARPEEGALNLSGSYCRIRQARQIVLRSEKAFAALWKEHRMSQEEPAPRVDFQKYDVVALYAGEKMTGGYSITIDRIRRDKKSATVEATLLKPGPDAITTQALTQPFALRAVPKLPKIVKFNIKEQIR